MRCVLGVGTFGDEEGCRPPTEEGLSYLLGIANQVTVAASRLRFVEQSRVQERARRALENRLAQMQRIESVGILAGGVAHDFNNLLTVILSGAMLAADEDDPEDRKRDLEIVIEAARRGQEVTRQLLAMSRSRPLVTSTVEPDERIGALVPLLRRVIPEMVTIELRAGADHERVEADPAQLDQVVMNLALNARDAMPEGGRLRIATRVVTVDDAFVTAHPWAVPGRYVEITVADDGTGMPSDVLERIFEPFFTTKGPRTGTGLGLTVALGIVKQHGGLLHCEGTPDRGTTFTIHWPVASRVGSGLTLSPDGPVLGGSESILLAEDDAAVGGVVRRILERAGYTVSVVPDGPTACATLASDAYDLAIFDVIMPGMSVVELVERAAELRPGLRILLASGYTAEAQVAELLREGKHTLLAKPFDPEQLLRAVRRRLDRP